MTEQERVAEIAKEMLVFGLVGYSTCGTSDKVYGMDRKNLAQALLTYGDTRAREAEAKVLAEGEACIHWPVGVEPSRETINAVMVAAARKAKREAVEECAKVAEKDHMGDLHPGPAYCYINNVEAHIRSSLLPTPSPTPATKQEEGK